MTITLPDGKVLIADNIIYDESTKTYNIDSHDVTNNYITYNYSWTYHINYTSITYIGQTEEYNKYYEVYYELPDGRDSADLTAEEVEQLNVSVDVIPYGRSADDTSLRSLYHFDGDTKDSSYWNYCTDFTWNKGASLTYMDAGVFNGALYLDEKTHDFTLTLPSNITSGDFTFQFRYYQSYTAVPQTDSYIQFGSTKLLQFTGSQFKTAGGTSLASTPIGSWNEVALIRDSGTLYYYLNGVNIGSISDTTAYDNTITFYFGSSQQTYKYLDELRVLNYALQTGGQSYECTSVPYDTNLSLVLPDSQVPVADEYWDIQPDSDAVATLDFSTGLQPDNLVLQTAVSANSSGSTTIRASQLYPSWMVYMPSNTLLFYGHSAQLTNTSTAVLDVTTSGCDGYPLRGITTCFGGRGSGTGYDVKTLDDGTYTASVVLADGTINSLTFDLSYPTTTKGPADVSASFDWGEILFHCEKTNTADRQIFLSIIPKLNKPVDIVYVELTAGDSTDLTAEFVTSITSFDKDSLNTPTLAVRTDLDITSYQIGGVRPSLPKKGQVWALVENERITSIQIYNGSAWEGCDGRIWTGERWVPASSYNIITLQDMYDIVDATQNYEYIYTESGFWSWWQKAWIAFTDKLFSVLGTGSGGSGGSSAPTSVKEALANALSALIESLFAVITTVLQSLLGLVTDMLSFFFNFLTETVLGGISSFFSIFTDGSLTEWFQQTGEDGSTTTGLPSEIITAFSFISGVIMLLPAELRGVLFFGIGLMLLMAVFKLVKE